MIYTFVKQVDISSLTTDIGFTSVGHLVSSVSSSGTVLSVETTRDLTDEEMNTLRIAIINHVAKDAAFDAVQERINESIDFGREILVEFATLNTLRNLQPNDIAALLGKLSPIVLMLLSGSLKTALATILTLKPDGHLVLQSNIDYFSQKIKRFLDG